MQTMSLMTCNLYTLIIEPNYASLTTKSHIARKRSKLHKIIVFLAIT